MPTEKRNSKVFEKPQEPEVERHEIEVTDYQFHQDFSPQTSGNVMDFVIDSNMPSSGGQSEYHGGITSLEKNFPVENINPDLSNYGILNKEDSKTFAFEWKKSSFL